MHRTPAYGSTRRRGAQLVAAAETVSCVLQRSLGQRVVLLAARVDAIAYDTLAIDPPGTPSKPQDRPPLLRRRRPFLNLGGPLTRLASARW